MLNLQAQPQAARYLANDIVEDVVDRLGFLRVSPKNALVVGDVTGALSLALAQFGAHVTRADPLAEGAVQALDEEHPYPTSGFDFIASLLTLDTVNDLPGALIHLRNALAPRGLAIVTMLGAGSLPALRASMLQADCNRPAPRLHPQVDVRASGQLLQRAGFVDPVVDSRGLDVRFSSLDALVADLRSQGLSNVLTRSGPPLGKTALETARSAFIAQGDEDGRVTEHFELLTLSGWRR
jgi:SAM-dependent methyltransferase